MIATNKEKRCISYSNDLRLKHAPEQKWNYFMPAYPSKEDKMLAQELYENDPPFNKEDIIDYYTLDFKVYGTKQFSHFWNTKGLRNSGVGYWNNVNTGFEDTMNCLEYWFCTLYDKSKADFQNLIEVVDAKNKEYIKNFMKENPNSFISPLELNQMIPEEIDILFGAYLMDFEITGDTNQLPPYRESKDKLTPKSPRETYTVGKYLNLSRLPF
jgi:hypothetical protein